jgi:hypothetical protein
VVAVGSAETVPIPVSTATPASSVVPVIPTAFVRVTAASATVIVPVVSRRRPAVVWDIITHASRYHNR